jgi:hypothetical protein
MTPLSHSLNKFTDLVVSTIPLSFDQAALFIAESYTAVSMILSGVSCDFISKYLDKFAAVLENLLE